MSRSRRRRRASLGPPLLVLGALTLLLLEAALRVERFGAQALEHPLQTMAPRFPAGDCLEPGPAGEPLLPHCSMYYKGVPIETNALGLNDREVDERVPHFRVAVLGDSLTMAAGLEPRRSYHALLEERIDRELGAPGFVEFYNLGRGGRSTGEELRDLEWIEGRLEPDAILVGLYRNDLWDNLLKGERCRSGDEKLQLSEPERAWYQRYREGGNPASAAAAWLERASGLWIFNRLDAFSGRLMLRLRGRPDPEALATLEDRALRLFRSCAGALRDRARAAGIPILFVDLSYRPSPESTHMSEEIARLGEPLLSMTDVHEAFDDPSELEIYPGDAHPSAAVHRIYAERLHGKLTELGWISRMQAALP